MFKKVLTALTACIVLCFFVYLDVVSTEMWKIDLLSITIVFILFAGIAGIVHLYRRRSCWSY